MPLPFRLMPASWGLKGDSYLEAEAAYTLQGEALERRLADIRHAHDSDRHAEAMLHIAHRFGHIDDYAFEKTLLERAGADPHQLLELDRRHERIDDYTFDRRAAELTTEPGAHREISLLEVELKHGKVTDRQYQRQLADLNKEPYIDVINSGFDPNQGISGVFFEFDWNAYWIDYLRLHGYGGASEEEIVERWFQDVCQSIAMGSELEDGFEFVTT